MVFIGGLNFMTEERVGDWKCAVCTMLLSACSVHATSCMHGSVNLMTEERVGDWAKIECCSERSIDCERMQHTSPV